MRTIGRFFRLSVLVAINMLLQFVFQWYLIVHFGAGTTSDIFFGTMALPQFILLVLSGSLTMVLIPMLSGLPDKDFRMQCWSYMQAVGIVVLAIAISLYFTAPIWVAYILPGFKGEQFSLAVSLSRIQLVGMFCSALLSILYAAHSAKEHFLLIEKSSLVANILSLILFYFSLNYFGIYAAAWVTVGRVLLQMLPLLSILGPFIPIDRKEPFFKDAWKKLRPLMAGNLYFKTDTLVDKYLTSMGAAGQLTLLNLAQQLYAALNSLLVKVLVNTMVPPLAKAYYGKDMAAFHKILLKRFFTMLGIALFIILSLLFFGKWMLAMVFTFKNFSAEDVEKLWWLLVLLAGFLLAGLLGSITSNTFYARGDTVTPTTIGAILFTIYVPIKVFCYYRFGIKGLALSVSVYYLVTLSLHVLILWMRYKKSTSVAPIPNSKQME